MKTFGSFFSVLLVIVCCVACNEYNESVEIYKSTFSGCKSQATSRSNDNSLPHERVVYEVKNGILTIQLIDCNVSCDLEKMDANISCDDHNNLTLQLIEVGGEANCICPMDFSFSIKNLTLGETYTCTIAERNYTFSFVFENGARGTVTPSECSKEIAYELVKQMIKEPLTAVDIYVSDRMIPANSDIPILGENILSPNTDSWLFFVDEMPKQNWSHPCQYIFVNKKQDILCIKKSMYPLENSLYRMEKISASTMIEKLNERFISSPINTVVKTKSIFANNNYAVIISGGGNRHYNHIRYWNDCSYIYRILTEKYNYNPANIYVLMADGTDPAIDNDSGTSFPIDLNEDGIADIDYAATISNISDVFKQLSSILKTDDNLFIYTIDHGGLFNDESYLVLWNNQILFASEFAEMVKQINTKSTNIVMGQCHSGGFIDFLNTCSNTCVSTACTKEERSYAMSNLQYDEYLYYWMRSHEKNVAGDANGDTYITAVESHSYAKNMDSKPEHPQHWGGGLLSRKLTLSGIVKHSFADYVDGYCTINGNVSSFYALYPDHEIEIGVPIGSRIDINITKPVIYENCFTWSIVEGNHSTSMFYPNNTTAHLEISSQADVGDKVKIKVEADIPVDDYYLSQFINLYVTSSYRITRTLDGILSISREEETVSSNAELSSFGEKMKTYEYQIIEKKTGAVRIRGFNFINKPLNLNISQLDKGIYTIIIAEDKQIKARHNISI